jgi:hypothetical protein
MRASITLYNAQQAHQELLALWADIKPWLIAGHRLSVSIKTENRSTAQNALMWSCLADVSRQVEWHGQMLDDEAWKDMATAALKRQRVVPGIDGGFVVLGTRTSRMTIGEMSELIDFLHAFGDERGVKWSRTSLGRDVPEEVFA